MKDYSPRFKFDRGDMTSRTWWHSFIKKEKPFDIIIDDGAHSRLSNQVMWQEVFGSSLLKDGGLYVIEDLGEGYRKQLPDGHKPDATTELAKQWIDAIHSHYGGAPNAKGAIHQWRKSASS